MEYNNLFEPLLCIVLSMCAGFLIGTIFTLIKMSKEQKALAEELDKFRELYFYKLDLWENNKHTKYE
tara:strand:+ start:304 stop:504 length:201 start_codon:yes stop_codon:yes gene_type:complete